MSLDRLRLAPLALMVLTAVACLASAQPQGPPAATQALVQEAQQLAATGQWQAALAKVEEAIPSAPDNGEAYNWQGYLLARLGRREEAIAGFANAVRCGGSIAYAQRSLETLLFQGDFPAWLDSRSLPNLPITSVPISIPLTDPRLSGSPQTWTGIVTTSPIYPDRMPEQGPTGSGFFNRHAYVLTLDTQTGRLVTQACLHYGSRYLWNTPEETISAEQLGLVAESALRAAMYAKSYFGSQYPDLQQGPWHLWLSKEEGEDQQAPDGSLILFGAGSASTPADRVRRTVRAVGSVAVSPTPGVRDPVQARAAEYILLTFLLLNADSSDHLGSVLAPAEAELTSDLALFLQNFPQASQELLADERYVIGSLVYALCQPEATVLGQVALRFGREPRGAVPCLERFYATTRALALSPALGANASPSFSDLLLGQRTLSTGQEATYWFGVGAGKWEVSVTARASAPSAFAATLKGRGLGQITLDPDKPAALNAGLGSLATGWYSLTVSAPAGASPVTVTAIRLTKQAEE